MSIEIRNDGSFDRTIIISTRRNKRLKHLNKCIFCPGMEKVLEKPSQEVLQNGKWILRAVPNKFPIFRNHEIIVETPRHVVNVDEELPDHIEELFRFYSDRYKSIAGRKGVKYVQLFTNRGQKAGASQVHAHSQIIGLPFMPKMLADELNSIEKHKKKSSDCLFCKTIKKEKKSRRFVYENKSFVAFCRYAPRHAYEVGIFPKSHVNDLSDIDFRDAADAYRKCVHAIHLALNNTDMNIIFHQMKQISYHAHINILPLTETVGGLERGAGVYVNHDYPEAAAGRLRKFIRKVKD
jgi:UDPglucose--hexose-1-phosphate uridylyltransferase